MAEMPSHIAGSSAQAGYQAREVGAGRAADRAGQAAAARRQVKAVDETDTTVETTDSDTAVFSDSEGAGSQGRAFEEAAATEEQEAAEESVPEGMTRGEDGELHLDLEA